MKNTFRDLQAMTVFAIASFLFFLSLSPAVSTIAFIIAIICWVANKNYKNSFRAFKQHKTWWVFISFYLLHIISLLWTTNFRYAFFDLQIKMGFLICPLVVAGFSFTPESWKTFRKAFIFGCSVAGMICIINAAWHFFPGMQKEYFFYGKFSVLMHPSYFMIYLNLSMLFILYQLFWDKEKKKSMRNFYVVLLFFQLIILFLLSGRTAMAVSMLTLLIYGAVLARKKMLSMKDARIFLSLIVVSVVFQLAMLKYYNRYDQIANVIKEPDAKEENSTSIRYNIWKISVDLISDHPFIGVGVGDLKEELVKKYQEYNYEYGIRTRISPHNQFLHTAVILGLIGAGGLLYLLACAFMIAWRNGDWLYLLFIIITFLNCMTESILERQAGILFFTFINSLFASRYIGTIAKRID
jgi:O-antigen ligase